MRLPPGRRGIHNPQKERIRRASLLFFNRIRPINPRLSQAGGFSRVLSAGHDYYNCAACRHTAPPAVWSSASVVFCSGYKMPPQRSSFHRTQSRGCAAVLMNLSSVLPCSRKRRMALSIRAAASCEEHFRRETHSVCLFDRAISGAYFTAASILRCFAHSYYSVFISVNVCPPSRTFVFV